MGASGARPWAERRSALRVWLRLGRAVVLPFALFLAYCRLPAADCRLPTADRLLPAALAARSGLRHIPVKIAGCVGMFELDGGMCDAELAG